MIPDPESVVELTVINGIPCLDNNEIDLIEWVGLVLVLRIESWTWN